MPMVILVIISTLLVVLYVGAAILAGRELPKSVSALVYRLPDGGKWIWGAWLCCVTMLLMPPLLEAMPEDYRFVGFFFGVSLLFTTAFPLYDEDNEPYHMVLAIASGLLSQLCVVILCADWLSAWMLYAFLMGSVYIQPDGWLGKAMRGKGVFVAETVCLISLVGSLLTCL